MRLTTRYIIAFLSLSLLMQELHELAHLLVDRLTVHCGIRYFLFWQMCNRENGIATSAVFLAGPAINFVFLVIGFTLLSKRTTSKQKSIGFSLVMACIPLQRLQAIVFRGSDEIGAFREILLPAPFKGAAVIGGVAVMLVFIIPALYRAFNTIPTYNRWLVMAAFLTAPFCINYALQQLLAGDHSRQVLLSKAGSFLPSWLTLIDLVLLILFLPFAKHIGQLFNGRSNS